MPELPDPSARCDLIIRSARARDAGSVGLVLTRSYSQLLAADYPAPLLRQVVPILSRPRPELLGLPSYLVAVKGGRIVAVGGWSRSQPGGGVGTDDVGHIRHVACDPDYLRQGITRALLEVCLASAEAAGIRLLSCLSTRTAVPFYRAMGFDGAAEIELRISPGVLFPAVEMRKWLVG